MAKEVIWSLKAQESRKDILTYWNNRNKSNIYSIKLNQLFKETIHLITVFPHSGRLTDIENIRFRFVRDYIIVYEESQREIIILLIWDSRQNPDKLKYLK